MREKKIIQRNIYKELINSYIYLYNVCHVNYIKYILVVFFSFILGLPLTKQHTVLYITYSSTHQTGSLVLLCI